SSLGYRLITTNATPALIKSEQATDPANYTAYRLQHGVPESSIELPLEKAILLEIGFDELNAIDWHKGCYVGQERIARTKHRGLVRKRLLPITSAQPLVKDTTIMQGDKEIGTVYTAQDKIGLAMIRLES